MSKTIPSTIIDGSESEENSQQPESLLRPDDSALAEKAFPGWKALFSETFMHRSRASYPLPWLVREIVQNFTDGNKAHPASLNGVTVNTEKSESGSTIITITGNWPFERYDSLVTLGSGKTEDAGSAGGNGIGFKQTVLRLMRDFEVSKCEVQGEDWTVQYKMGMKEEINDRLEKKGDNNKVQHGSLMVRAESSGTKGVCKYIFELQDKRVEEAFSDFQDLGVHTENKYLQNMDFQNEHGALKWLQILPKAIVKNEEGNKPKFKFLHEDQEYKFEEGRLYINGQVFRFRDNSGNKTDEFWGGPQGITIQLNNVNYPMTLDRPPFSNWELESCSHALIRSMRDEELKDNLFKSEYIWASGKLKDSLYNRPFALEVIKMLVNQISSRNLSLEEYKKWFEEKKYLCEDVKLTQSQTDNLIADGYTICSDFFVKLNMPKASGMITDFDNASSKKPNSYDVDTARFAASEESGISVPFERIKLKNYDPLYVGKYFQDRGKSFISNITRIEKNKIRINLNCKIDKKELSHDEFWPHKGTNQELLNLIRGLAYTGIAWNIFKDIYMAQGDYVTTFSRNGNKLLIKNNKASSNEVFIDIEMEAEQLEKFYKGLTGKFQERARNEPVEDDEDKESGGIRDAFKYLKTPAKIISAVAGAVVFIIGTETALNNMNEKDNAQIHEETKAAGEIPEYKKIQIDTTKRKNRSLSELITSRGSPEKTGIQAVYEREVEAAGGYSWKNILIDVLNTGRNTPVETSTVENFEIVKNPNSIQIRQLEILKEFIFLSTGYEIKNNLYLFRGSGAYGLHNSAISIHENMLKYAGFEETIGTLVHEIAHEKVSPHNSEFSSVMGAILTEIENTLGNIARTPESQRTDVDTRILQIEEEWNDLQRSNQSGQL